METVLGLSMTSGSVGWVVLDGAGADAAILDHDVFDVAGGSAADGDICNHVATVRGVQAIAAASGHELTSIGVTWTDDAAAAANLVLRALPGLGFAKVVPVRLAEARALASNADQDMLARGAALAVMSNAETVPVRLPAVVAMRKQSRFASPVRAAALVAGLSVLFVVGPEFGGQPQPTSAENQPASDPAISVSIEAVQVPVTPSPVADAIQLVVGHPEPAAPRRSTQETAEPVTVRAPVEQIPVVALSNEVALAPADVAPQPEHGPLPGPAVAPTAEPAAMPAAPATDPAQVVMSPLFSALP
ncbi:hypothetical protein AB4Z42_26135 [Mycobacterium sp. 2YAF39]|uniref:hypothetical protein n=1 Tax=Mycobacterium sp. 2YAF39 TaxID=3233033 RepID=UPI003F99FF80